MRKFCTDHAIACGEPLAGTAKLAERHLFVQWPKGRWRRPRFEAVGLHDALRAQMKAASGGGRYVGLVDGEELAVLSFPDSVRVVPQDQEHAAALVKLWHDGLALAGMPLRRTVLCCTDARTDACCARYGFPLFKALTAAAPAYGIDVLQCTHIGGCHMAPSVIVMPERQRYGRLRPDNAEEFLSTIARGEVYLPSYSGNPALGEMEQVAETAVRQLLVRHGPPGQVTISNIAMHSPTQAMIDVRVDDQSVQVRVEQQIFSIYGNCWDMDGEPKDKARWVATIS